MWQTLSISIFSTLSPQFLSSPHGESQNNLSCLKFELKVPFGLAADTLEINQQGKILGDAYQAVNLPCEVRIS